MSLRIATLSILFLAIASGCRKDPLVLPPDPGYHYFPADSGLYWIYHCDSTVFNDFTGTTDTSSFYLKEILTEEFDDLEGRPSLRMERWVSRYDTLNWELRDAWYLTRGNLKLETFEEDVRYVRLVFPVKDGRTWNVNAMNNIPSLDYSYTDLHQPFVNDFLLEADSAVTVLSEESDNLIEMISHEFVYGRRIGLMRKKITELSTSVTGNIESGYIYQQELLSYGR